MWRHCDAVVGVLEHDYGGWVALNPETSPRPDFYQTPSQYAQWRWMQLGFMMFAYPFYPVVISRIYAAKELKGIRAGAWANYLGIYASILSAVFIGTMGVQIIGDSCQDAADPETCSNPASPFASILNYLMLKGGFSEVAAVLLYTSALAAIMSTTGKSVKYPFRVYGIMLLQHFTNHIVCDNC